MVDGYRRDYGKDIFEFFGSELILFEYCFDFSKLWGLFFVGTIEWKERIGALAIV